MFHVAATSATRPLEPISKAWRVSGPSPMAGGALKPRSSTSGAAAVSQIDRMLDAGPSWEAWMCHQRANDLSAAVERGIAEPAGELLPQNSLGEVMRYEGAAQPREHRMRTMTSSGSCARRTLESASRRFVRASLSRRMVSRRSSPARFCFNARLSKSPACTNGEPYAATQSAIRALALRHCRDRFSRFERDCARASLCMRVRVTHQLGSEAGYQRFGESACVFPPEPATQARREGGERAGVCLQSIGPRVSRAEREKRR